jgi:hypothetical protein
LIGLLCLRFSLHVEMKIDFHGEFFYAQRNLEPPSRGTGKRRQKWNVDPMSVNDDYVVRVSSLAGAAGLFIWEICRGDGLAVLQRSTKTFPTRVEALFDSAQSATILTLDMAQHLSLI